MSIFVLNWKAFFRIFNNQILREYCIKIDRVNSSTTDENKKKKDIIYYKLSLLFNILEIAKKLTNLV